MFSPTKVSLILVTGLYALCRLPNLLTLPIFNDEVMYLWMAKQIVNSPAQNLFINFFDGKEPLYFWALATTIKISPFPPLLTGRLLSVLCGLITAFVFYFLARRILSFKSSLFASLVFVTSPLLALHQRLTLIESFLLLFLTLDFYLLLIFYKKPTLASALYLGISLGLSLLTKTTALVFLLFLLPAAFLLVTKPKLNLGLSLLLFLIVGGLYRLIIFHPQFHMIADKNHVFSLTLSELLKNPFQVVLLNLRQVADWLLVYSGLALASLLVLKPKRNVLALGLLFGLPILLEIVVAKIFFPRYLIFCLLPLSLLVGETFSRVKPLALAILIYQIYFCLTLQFSPLHSPLPTADRWQYLSGWPSGYGLKEISEFLQKNHIAAVQLENIDALSYRLHYFYPTLKINEGDYYLYTAKQTDFPKDLTEVYDYSRPGGDHLRLFKKL